MAVALEKKTRRESTKLAVIDCDIHNIPPSEQALTPYLPKRWRRHHQTYPGQTLQPPERIPGRRPALCPARIWTSCVSSFSIPGT